MSLEAPKHECGVVGILSPNDSVSDNIYYSLLAMQNRGQEAAGAAVFDNQGVLRHHVGLGLVNAVFRPEDIKGLEGNIGIGHVRYGTTGSPSIKNAQPFIVDSDLGRFALVHNGNIFNASELKAELLLQGETFTSTSDSEVMALWIARSPGGSFVDKIKAASQRLMGAYSYVIATPSSLIGGRDPYGTWPLSLGRFNGSGYMMASETNGIERSGGEFYKEVENGQIVVIDREGITYDFLERKEEALCMFEFQYFSDPYSSYLGRRVEGARFDMGRILAQEHPLNADWVVPIPETARPAAEGYSFESKIPLRGALTRNRWYGRTFIEPDEYLREMGAALKYGPLAEVLDGATIVLIDDSIVRGTTTEKIVRLVKLHGAKKVYMLSASPPIVEVCHLGVDTARKAELAAARMTEDQIRDSIGADYLGYISLEGGIQAIGPHLRNRLCMGCFTGQYKMQVPDKRNKFVLEVTS